MGLREHIAGWFGKKQKQLKESDSLLHALDGRSVKYVTKRNPVDYGEIIIGRDGFINVHEDELIIACGNEIVFRYPLMKLQGAELMSLEGINLRYRDEETGENHTVIAYYKYYR